MNKWTKVIMVALVVIGAFAVSMALLTGTSEAGGPGNGNGRGGGQGGNGGGGQGGNGGGQQIQDGTGTGMLNPLGGQSQYGGQGGYGNSGSTTQQGGGILVNLPPASTLPLTNDAIAALVAGINDEYHAYATYGSIIDQFGAVRPFTSIQNSEQSHIDSLAYLFDRYGLTVPAADPTFVAPQFATLADACAAGAAAEVANFDLYDQWLATVSDYPDLVYVFTALRDASEFQHLPAFERCAG